jgi:hypothetical protein
LEIRFGLVVRCRLLASGGARDARSCRVVGFATFAQRWRRAITRHRRSEGPESAITLDEDATWLATSRATWACRRDMECQAVSVQPSAFSRQRSAGSTRKPRSRQEREAYEPTSEFRLPQFRRSAFCTLQSALRILHSAFCTLHSALRLPLVRAPAGAHRGWDPGGLILVRAPRFAHHRAG